ncbi:AzlD domain-containing protein [Longispora albida]|uniref:AzlD domain-containing protein n=1 Tax=Longispora albida TaxID=203523 RepID=UPI00037A5EDE|nr:AzlD domain-containing protein [Longispora albida]
MSVWVSILVLGIGCYALKLAGLSAPRGLLDRPAVGRFAAAIPVALLAALIAIQTVTERGELAFDPARAGGLLAAAAALLARAPFLLVLVIAAGTAAAIRFVYS